MRFSYMPDTHFGVYDQAVPTAREASEAFQQLIREAELAEAVGFDGIFLPERHMRPETFAPSPLTVAAAIAARTRRIKIATTVMLPPLYNPMHLAEQISMVDNLSQGRFIFGAAVGYHRDYHRMFGVPWEKRGNRFEEAMDVIVKAISGERFTFHGEYYHFEDVFLTPLPFQRPRPPIWIGAYADKAVDRALDYEGWVLWNLPEWDEAEAWVKGIRQRVAQRGKENWSLVMNQDGWIGDDPDAVRARHAPRWVREAQFYADQGTTGADIEPRGDIFESEGFRGALRDFESRQMHFGTPESWRARIGEITTRFAPDWLNIRTRGPRAESGPEYPTYDESLECIERFGVEVIRVFQ